MGLRLMRLLVIVLLGLVVSTNALAQNDGASFAVACSGLSGYSHSLRDNLPTDLNGFQPDRISNGRILVLIGPENGAGGAEVKFRDSTGHFISATADGARVEFLGFDEGNRIARVEAHYPSSGVTESYLLKFASSSQAILLLMSTVRPSGAVPKMSIFSGRCEAF